LWSNGTAVSYALRTQPIPRIDVRPTEHPLALSTVKRLGYDVQRDQTASQTPMNESFLNFGVGFGDRYYPQGWLSSQPAGRLAGAA
jgi:hypothetical protein